MKPLRALVFSLIAASLGFSAYYAAPALAIAYPAGWNLVAGPDGSTLVGATGSVYTWQPGDTAYEVSDASAPLRACRGYWAYFPSGGSLTAGADTDKCSVSGINGGWVMVGDPSATGPAVVTGADSVLTYTPAAGYQAATTLPAGSGAWVIAQGAINISASSAPPAPSTTPAPAPAPAPSAGTQPRVDLSTPEGLNAVGLQPSDLPGYTKATEQKTSFGMGIIGYLTLWAPSSSSQPFVTVLLVYSGSTSTAPADVLDAIKSEFLSNNMLTAQRELGPQGIGERDDAIYFQQSASGRTVGQYLELFARGPVIAVVSTLGEVGSNGVGSLDLSVKLARVVDGRITAATAGR